MKAGATKVKNINRMMMNESQGDDSEGS